MPSLRTLPKHLPSGTGSMGVKFMSRVVARSWSDWSTAASATCMNATKSIVERASPCFRPWLGCSGWSTPVLDLVDGGCYVHDASVVAASSTC
eukprot:6491019-Amphidinium_carterae.4